MIKLKKHTAPFIMIIVFLLCINPIVAEDYQYQYFSQEKKKYVPFSDYIPKVRLHYKTVPHYLEDYYELYHLKQYYKENNLRRNIEILKTALNCKFRHPSQALIAIDDEKQYLKYRKVMFMHIKLHIMRNYMRIASRYDKHNLRFHDLDFAKEIRDSLNIAERFYKEAIPYWREAVKYAKSASEIKISLDMGKIETDRYRIITGDLDFNRIISFHLSRLNKKKAILDAAIAAK